MIEIAVEGVNPPLSGYAVDVTNSGGIQRHLPAELSRARRAATRAAEVRAAAARARAVAVAAVSRIATRHGHRLRPALPATVRESLSTVFTAAGVREVRHKIAHMAADAGLSGDDVADFELAVQELMTNAIRHGGGWGRVRVYRDGPALACSMTDYGPGFAGGPAESDFSPPTDLEGGRGIFLVRQLTDDVRISSDRTGSRGTVVTVTMRLPGG